MALKIYTQPALEPVSLEEIKDHLRVSHTADDSLLRDLIQLARTDIETLSMHAMITQTWDMVMDGFPGGSEIELPFPPLQSVTGVYYTPESTGVEATYSSSNYSVDIYNKPGKIVLDDSASWPGDALSEVNGVRVRFVCGFGDDPSDVDIRLRHAIKLLVGHYYENREAVFAGRTSPVLLPMGINSLVWDFRARLVKF